MTQSGRSDTRSISEDSRIGRYFHCVLAALLSLVGVWGCTAEEYCDIALNDEWDKISVDRTGLKRDMRRPTSDESDRLRTVINRCKSVRTEFDLNDDLVGPWATATTMLLGVELDDPALLNQLVAEGHAPDGLPNDLGISTLYFAVHRQAENAFEWALEKGVDPNLPDTEGVSPLMIAAVQPQDRVESIRALVSRGAKLNAVSNTGWTAMGIAIRDDNVENVMLLARLGADFDLARNELQKISEQSDAKEEIAALILAFEERLASQGT